MIKKTPNLPPFELGPQQPYLFSPFEYEAGPSFEPDKPAPTQLETPEALAMDQSVQLTFLPEVEELPVRTTKRAAFGRYVGPEHHDPFREHDFSRMPEGDKKWITPSLLRAGLFPSKDEVTRMRVFKVNLNPFEFKTLIRARSASHIHNDSFNNTLGYERPDEELLARSVRSGNHTVEKKLGAMRQHTESMMGSVGMLKRLSQRAQAPGRGHETDQNLKDLYINAWYEYENMMNVAHVAFNWTDEERDRADTSFLYYLTQGSQRIRVNHWKSILSLVTAYTSARVELFNERIEAAVEILEANGGDIRPGLRESSPAA